MDHKLRKLNRILLEVRRNEEKIKELTDDELKAKTVNFRKRIDKGESLNSILPEAFAVACEADFRVLGMRPRDCQVLGGVALHQGYLAEMNTGEGKTLTATLPLYLNGLTGRGAYLLTNNEYLALRDAKEMGPVYEFLGLTISAGVKDRTEEEFDTEKKKQIYSSDIIYSTHAAIGFDYLFNNLASSAEDRFMGEFFFCIIDEADSVLLDSATMPLVIAGSPRVQSNLYSLADFFVTTLVEGKDYEVKEKETVYLTEEGSKYAEEFFCIDNFYSREHFEINRHVSLALRAHKVMSREKDYVINHKNEMVLLDGSSGRMMDGVKLRGGLHQAIEEKEKVSISQETRSVASVTYQYFFRLFGTMSGMSGTIADAKTELLELYGKKTIIIPPNKPVQRKDMKDLYFSNATDQIYAAVTEIIALHDTGRPVLVVASNIKETELISRLLIEEQIPHNVLNANNAYWEAEIIADAGKLDAVTVSTSMAGRGTDIKLGPGVVELGGLAVIGIGRLINTRNERQARGRAGRQGDPGMSRFYVSLEDDVVKKFGAKKIEKLVEKNKKVGKGRLKKLINGAQKASIESNVTSRKNSGNYDEVMRHQRELIYNIRGKLLDGGTLSREKFFEIANKNVKEFVSQPVSRAEVSRYILDNITYMIDDEFREVEIFNKDALTEFLMKQVYNGIENKRSILKSRKNISDFMRIATLHAIDNAWVEEVDYLQQLQYAVSGRSYAQRNPIYEYQRDAFLSFKKMEKAIYHSIMRNVLLGEATFSKDGKMRIIYP